MEAGSFQAHKILLKVSANKFFLQKGMLKMSKYQHKPIKQKHMNKVLKSQGILLISTNPLKTKTLIKTELTFTIMKPLYRLLWN